MSALNKKSFLTYLKEGGIYVVLLVLLAFIIFQDPTFLSLLNLSNILYPVIGAYYYRARCGRVNCHPGDRSFCWSSGRVGGSGGCDIIAVHG